MNRSTSDDLLKVEEVAELLRVAPKTIRQWVYREMIPNRKINGIVRFSRSEIEVWIADAARARD